MAITANSPLDTQTVGKPFSIELGDRAAGYIWDIPPGSTLPPGLECTSSGVLRGVPTIPGEYTFYVRETNTATKAESRREFYIKIQNPVGITEAEVNVLVNQAFTLGRASTARKFWFEESTDDQNRRVISLKYDDNGTQRIVASIAI